jgi:hypothetical protein
MLASVSDKDGRQHKLQMIKRLILQCTTLQRTKTIYTNKTIDIHFAVMPYILVKVFQTVRRIYCVSLQTKRYGTKEVTLLGFLCLPP